MALQVTPGYKKIPAQQASSGHNSLADLITIGGGLAGAYFAGPGGAAQGAAMGLGLGQSIGGLVTPPKPIQGSNEQIVQPASLVPTDQSSMQRRQAELGQSDQNYKQLMASIDSLQYIQDPDLKLKFAEPLLRADMAAQKQNGQV